MGKRKGRKKMPVRAAAPKLDQDFDCPFCYAIKSVSVNLRKRELIALLTCRKCHITYETAMSPLDEAVDIFSAWIDSCEEVNSAGGIRQASPMAAGIPLRGTPVSGNKRKGAPLSAASRKRRAQEEEEEEEANLEEEEEANFDYEDAADDDDDEEEAAEDDIEQEEPFPVPKGTSDPPVSKRGRLKSTNAWGGDDEEYEAA